MAHEAFVNPYLSVVIPAYNEAERIGATLDQVKSFLQRQPYSSEIILVDDGSRDRTSEIASEKLAKFPHRILKNPANFGKGNAVKRGMLTGSGRFLLFSDADLSTPIENVTEFLTALEKGSYSLVIGSRAVIGSQIERHQPFWREEMGKIFNRLARLWTFRAIRDSQCGFKCFTQEAARSLFSLQRIDGFSFDVEIIYLAQKLGYRILEAPVTWRNSPQSRVRLISDPLHMLVDILRIRGIHRNLVTTRHA